jgi:1,4-dihydroxy-2-naphthoate octaprenyltransferase
VPTAGQWLSGARPRTLPAAIVPVVVGSGVAVAQGHVIWWRSAVALVVALALQIGVNFANDYSDGVRGTDRARVGPARLVAAGVEPALVRRAAALSFAVAALAGLVLALATSLWLLAVGAACIAAAWLYTGGPRPYGYAGLGEVFVFVFFGLVAVGGTAYLSLHRVTGLAIAASVPIGLLTVALLVVNNLRDIESDALAGKHTLAVRLGAPRTRQLYAALVVAAFGTAIGIAVNRPLAAIAVAAVLVAIGPVRSVLEGSSGRSLVEVLGMTGRLLLVFGALLAIGIAA